MMCILEVYKNSGDRSEFKGVLFINPMYPAVGGQNAPPFEFAPFHYFSSSDQSNVNINVGVKATRIK